MVPENFLEEILGCLDLVYEQQARPFFSKLDEYTKENPIPWEKA